MPLLIKVAVTKLHQKEICHDFFSTRTWFEWSSCRRCGAASVTLRRTRRPSAPSIRTSMLAAGIMTSAPWFVLQPSFRAAHLHRRHKVLSNRRLLQTERASPVSFILLCLEQLLRISLFMFGSWWSNRLVNVHWSVCGLAMKIPSTYG